MTKKRPRLEIDAASREALEFDQLLDWVAGNCHTAPGRRRLLALRPFAELEAVLRENRRVDELRRWYGDHGVLVSGGLPDPQPSVEILSVTNGRLEAKQLRELAICLREATRLAKWDEESCPALSERMRSGAHFDREVVELLNGIEPDGRLSDQASERLASCRRRRAQVAGRLRRQLESVLTSGKQSEAIQDAFVTQRNGRFVVPVRSDATGEVPGIVHASSSSGATRFVEPFESVEANNELVELEELEREEIERLTVAWSEGLRLRFAEIEAAIDLLAEVDSIQARARFGEAHHGVAAEVGEAAPIELEAIRHPLLERHLSESGGRCVPLDLRLEPSDRILVISGPNTGGKTVALKSVGLAVLMAQSGIPLLAAKARLPLYRQLRADVGDHQSIAADLSTFSAHMTVLAEAIDRCAPPALFLFDELGSGTDPSEGAALAQAALERLAMPGCTTLATTHQNALKQWAFSDDRASSAAMEIHADTLRPTYRILPGVVGLSAALSIAESCRLPLPVVERARELLGSDSQRNEELLNRLRERGAELDRQLEAQSQEATERERQWAEREATFKREQQQQRQELNSSLEKVIKKFRQRAREALGQMTDISARRAAQKVAESRERELKAELQRQTVDDAPKPEQEGWLPLVKPSSGGEVFVRSLGKRGRIARVEGKKIVVEVGAMQVSVLQADLLVQPESRKLSSAANPVEPQQKTIAAVHLASGSSELMLIGMRVEEALEAVEKALDRALLAEREQLRIVHGHGGGRLKRAVRDQLKGHPLVASFRPGEEHEGGDGATIALLR